MSIVEILVGMAIGLMVTLAAVSSLIFIRLSSATAEDAWRVQQDANTAFRIIGWQLRQAGARPLVASMAAGSVEFAPGYSGFGSATDPRSIAGNNGAGPAPDSLQTSLQNDADADARDCLGLRPSAGTNDVRNLFSVGGGDLTCTGTSTTAAFLSGVEDMQVWYAETDGNRLQYRDQPVNWPDVKAVMVCLRIAGERQGQAAGEGTGCTGESLPVDGRLRRVFVRVFQIRNLSE